MKRFLRLTLCALLAMICVSAKAVTFTVVANPDHFESITGGANTSMTPLEYSLEGVENVIDDMSYIYLEFTPKANVEYVVNVYNSDGELKHTWKKNAKYKGFAMKANLDGGRIVVESTMADSTPTMSITINGNPADVRMDFSGNQVTNLHEGANDVEIGGRYLYIKHADPSHKFYHLTYNGVEKNAEVDYVTGGYQYLILDPKDGDVMVIDVNYPDIAFNVTIAATDADFISSVTVDGTAVEDWREGFTAKYGQRLLVQGNRRDYKVNETSINGVPTEYPSAAVERLVEGDIDIAFDVTKIVRDKSFVFYVANRTAADIVSANNNSTTFDTVGYNVFEYGEIENPFLLMASSTSQSTSQSFDFRKFCYVNDELVASDFSSVTYTAQDGDVVKMYIVEGTTSKPIDEPARYTYSYTVEGSGAPVVMKDLIVPAPASGSVLVGTSLRIASSATANVTAVEANGTPVDVFDGACELTISGPQTIKIFTSVVNSITDVPSSNETTSIYTINGVKVNQTTLPGLYIVNGKKVVVK